MTKVLPWTVYAHWLAARPPLPTLVPLIDSGHSHHGDGTQLKYLHHGHQLVKGSVPFKKTDTRRTELTQNMAAARTRVMQRQPQ